MNDNGGPFDPMPEEARWRMCVKPCDAVVGWIGIVILAVLFFSIICGAI